MDGAARYSGATFGHSRSGLGAVWRQTMCIEALSIVVNAVMGRQNAFGRWYGRQADPA